MSSEKHHRNLHHHQRQGTSPPSGESKRSTSEAAPNTPKCLAVAASSDFSIEHILHRAGKSSQTEAQCDVSLEISGNDLDLNNWTERFAGRGFEPRTQHLVPSWLHCTRYCPPKIPRTQKREGPAKRQLGRHPRIPFSSQQLAILEDRFKRSPYLSSSEVTQISTMLQLADVRVKIWFQNRRARERREKSSQDQITIEHHSGIVLKTSSTNHTSPNNTQIPETTVKFEPILGETDPQPSKMLFHNFMQIPTSISEATTSTFIPKCYVKEEYR